MHHFKAPSLGLLLLASTAPAAAEPGTPEEAAALQQRMERYVGRTAFAEGAVTITPDSEGYRIAVHPDALLSRLLAGTDVSLEVEAFEARLSRREDGDWDVAGEHPERFRFAFALDGEEIVLAGRMADARYTSVIADETGTTLLQEDRIASTAMTQEDAASITESEMGRIEQRIQSRDTGPGLVDATLRQTVESVRDTTVLKPDAPAPAGDEPDEMFDLGPMATRIGPSVVDASVSSLRAGALWDLWALGVERAEAQGGDADGSARELQAALRALGPLWDRFSGQYRGEDFALETSFGTLSVDRFDQGMAFDGLVPSGEHRLSFGFEGLDLSSDFLPPFAATLVPRSVFVDLAVQSLDLATPAGLLAENLDPALDTLVPPEIGEAILASFVDRPPRILVEPSRIVGDGYDLAFEMAGEWDGAGYGLLAELSAGGLDAIVSKLLESGGSEALQLVGALSLVKGFGRSEPDGRTAWTVERQGDGSVTVNGVEMIPADPEPSETPRPRTP